MSAGRCKSQPARPAPDAFGFSVDLETLTRSARATEQLSIVVAADASGIERARRKDIGLAACGGGFTVYVGGNDRTRGQLLGHARSERLAIEYVCALIELHRLEGKTGGGMLGLRRHTGLPYLRERVIKDPLGRSILARDFLARTSGNPKNCAFPDGL